MAKTPKIVVQCCEDNDWDEDYLREYIRIQVGFFRDIPDPGTDLTSWIALKVTCSRAQASQLLEWAM